MGGMQPPRLVFVIVSLVIMWLKFENPGASTYIGVDIIRAITHAESIRIVTVLSFLLIAYLNRRRHTKIKIRVSLLTVKDCKLHSACLS